MYNSRDKWRWYVEKAEDIWHPTVATEPQIIFPTLSLNWIDEAHPGIPDTQPSTGMVMIFLKWFDPEYQSLLGWRPVYVQLGDKMATLQGIIADMLGKDKVTGVIEIYEEIKPGMIERVVPARTFRQNEIGNGDIIVFTPKISSERYLPHRIT